MSLSKGVNRELNALRQAMRKEFHQSRLAREDRIQLIEAERAEDEVARTRIPSHGWFVDTRGVRPFPHVFEGMSDREIQRCGHILRNYGNKCDEIPENPNAVRDDFAALARRIPPRGLTNADARVGTSWMCG